MKNYAQENYTPGRVTIIVSLKIRPYIETIEGVREYLAEKGTDIDVYYLEDYEGKQRDALLEKLSESDSSGFIAIGPEAAVSLWENPAFDQKRKVFSMVLNPERLLISKDACGISLNIPIEAQLNIFAAGLPELKRIGLLYNPENNSDFSMLAVSSGRDWGLNIIPLEVNERREIPEILKKAWSTVDAVWLIPDQTIIEESLVRYIIRNAISNGVAVFGYNRFFYECGAVLSYEIKYNDIGEQTARLFFESYSEPQCDEEPPRFNINFNYNVMSAMGIEVDSGGLERFRTGVGD